MAEPLEYLGADWARCTSSLGGHPDALAAIGSGLLASWGESARSYHNLTHLQQVLVRLDELAGYAADPTAVRLAAWYHDAVYDGRPDDEELSAQRAERELSTAGVRSELVAEVARLVRLTARHDPEPGDRDGEALCDADLAVLAGDAGAYSAYAAAVRAEYALVPDEAFRVGRATILRALLDGPSLFRTPHGRAHWEAAARANLSAELSTLAT